MGTGRTISTTSPLSGGGDLSGDRTLSISTNGIDDTLLRDSAALSVIGRSANSTGDPADIAAGSDGDILRRSGTTLGFGGISAASITSGTLPIARGGTNTTSQTTNGVLFYNGTSITSSSDIIWDGTHFRALNVYTGGPGDSNTYLGEGLPGNVTSSTGTVNVGIGYASLSSLTSGSNNVAVGRGAMLANQGGNNNAAFGDFALTANTSGLQNMAIGSSALRNNTTGSNNVAVGQSALAANIGANSNMAIGTNSLTANQSGAFNVGVGSDTLFTNVSGNANIAIGDSALKNVVSNNNVGIGKESLLSATTGASSNTAIGYESGKLVSSGANNVLIGRGAADALTSGSANIVLGYNVDLPSNTGSNQMSIGNIIFGSGVDGQNTTVSSGKVGIRVPVPTYDLSLYGDAAYTVSMERHSTANTAGNILTVASGGATSGATDKNGGNLVLASGTATGTGSSSILFQTATAGATGTADRAVSTKMTILGSGFVGIGETAPLSKLHLTGASGWIIQDEQDTDPTTTELDSLDSIAIYNKSNKFVIAYNNASTITYISIPLDGSTTTWTHSTSAP